MIRGRKLCEKPSGCGKHYSQEHTEACPHCGNPEWASTLLPFDNRDWIYDLETYPNIFTMAIKHARTGERRLYEISQRRNDTKLMMEFLYWLKETGARMVGFNNVGFDYPILHALIERYCEWDYEATDAYNVCERIINTPWNRRFDNVIWDSDTHIQQIDLFKVHHFDNDARRTSLKVLEFNMQSQNIKDLPFPPGTMLTSAQMDDLIKYNWHDIDETEKFYIESIPMIEFRDDLSKKYGRNFLNHNDTKIGKDYFIMELERLMPGSCYHRVDGKREPRQTIRPSININDVIFPNVVFEQPEFQRVRNWLASQVITETKGVFDGLHAEIDGFKYDFGVGGIHGSVASTTVRSDDDYVIFDWDVASYYPNLAIANRLYPEHLSEAFCDIYKDVYLQRKGFAKGTAENAMLKLALNGVYGDSNNKYSPFYDPQYTMSITINGQLLLCMLAEQLIKTPGLSMIQINTDGLTVKCPRVHVDHMKAVCAWWETYTGLELESAVYDTMYIRDVNNYVATYEGGGMKRKGAYEYDLQWHQNHSQRAVPKAAEAVLKYGITPEQAVYGQLNINDFMLRAKVGRNDTLTLTQPSGESVELQKISRYYVSNSGGALKVIRPPAGGKEIGTWCRGVGVTNVQYDQTRQALLAAIESGQHIPHPEDLDAAGVPWDGSINTKNRSKYKMRNSNLNAGYLVTECNDIADADASDINYQYYIDEVKKLIEPLQNGEYYQ